MTDVSTAYSDRVCKPPAARPGEPLPPCINIENIEFLCYPNGTAPIYLAAHAQCMCHGSFFDEWNACRRCLAVHGQLTGDELGYYEAVATAASTSLCAFLTYTPSGPPATTPTAIFRDLFTSAQARLPSPTADDSTATDSAPGVTDVDVYFTATRPLGPGPITGSATAATATGLVLATGIPPALTRTSSSTSQVPSPTPSTTHTHSSSALLLRPNVMWALCLWFLLVW